MAEALGILGSIHSFVVHGRLAGGGLDEISTVGPTDVYEVCGSDVRRLVWNPEDFGVPNASVGSLQGGDAEENSKILKQVLQGEQGARRDIVLVNSAAGLVACGLASDLTAGMQMAAESIDSGQAFAVLEKLQQIYPAG
jgi:anthranilate phosphoribosyltransferase